MEILISKYIFLFSKLLHILSGGSFYSSVNNTPKKISYSWWGRLWRILKFLRRSRKKRKSDQRKKKQDKQSEKQKQKRFLRRKRWRKLKVVVKSFFRQKRISPQKRALLQRKKFLKKWRMRRRRRLFMAFVTGLSKRKKISKRKQEYIARIQREEAYQKYRKKRIYRFIFKRNLQILKDVLSGKGLPKKKKRRESVWKQIWDPKQLSITVNSLMFFLLSYYFIAFFDKLSMSITSLLFDYKTVIYYYKIEFLVDYDDWFADSVKAIFATGPIMGLLIAFLSIIIYSIVYLETGLLKNLLLWSIFHGINRIVSGTLVGSMIGKGFGYVVMYLYYSDTGKLVMSLLMIAISVIVGTVSTKYWIMTANSYYNYSKPNNRQVYMLNQLLLPYIFGNIFIYLINLPKFVYYNFLVNLFMIFMIIPPLFLNKYQQEYYFDEEPKSIKISIKTILFAIIFIGAYRILLDFGLRIG